MCSRWLLIEHSAKWKSRHFPFSAFLWFKGQFSYDGLDLMDPTPKEGRIKTPGAATLH